MGDVWTHLNTLYMGSPKVPAFKGIHCATKKYLHPSRSPPGISNNLNLIFTAVSLTSHPATHVGSAFFSFSLCTCLCVPSVISRIPAASGIIFIEAPQCTLWGAKILETVYPRLQTADQCLCYLSCDILLGPCVHHWLMIAVMKCLK